jgi:hypothetical protein
LQLALAQFGQFGFQLARACSTCSRMVLRICSAGVAGGLFKIKRQQ